MSDDKRTKADAIADYLLKMTNPKEHRMKGIAMQECPTCHVGVYRTHTERECKRNLR